MLQGDPPHKQCVQTVPSLLQIACSVLSIVICENTDIFKDTCVVYNGIMVSHYSLDVFKTYIILKN